MLRGVVRIILGKKGKWHTWAYQGKPDATASDKRQVRIMCGLTAATLSHGLQVLTSSAVSSAIAALSPGGVLMQTGTQQAINRKHAPLLPQL